MKLTKRFMVSMGLVADIVEYIDHVMNFNDTKDTLLFLFIASAFLYTYQFALVYLPIMLVLRALYASSKNESYPQRELNFKKSYRIIQRIMRDTADYVEFYDMFMKHYIFWVSKEKTLKLIIEMLKLSALGVLLYLFIPFNYILISALWLKVFQRSHFFW